DVVAGCPRAIDFDGALQALAGDEMAKHAFGRGRAADVSQADEANLQHGKSLETRASERKASKGSAPVANHDQPSHATTAMSNRSANTRSHDHPRRGRGAVSCIDADETDDAEPQGACGGGVPCDAGTGGAWT